MWKKIMKIDDGRNNWYEQSKERERETDGHRKVDLRQGGWMNALRLEQPKEEHNK